jgi:predicted nucleic acid-binding protein
LIVADANVLVYLCLPGQFNAEAAICLKKDPQWVSPLLWRSEYRNVLAIYLRKGLLNLAEAKLAYQKAEKVLNGQELSVPAEDVLDLVFQSTCSAYDCEYVALARKLGVKLVTKDAKVLREFPHDAIDLEMFVRP